MTEINFGGLNILVVEDEPLLRRQIRGNLERLGADVSLAESLGSAREWLQSENFDFVMLDVNLPDGLGTDLLKARAFPPATAVIVMTAQGSVASAVEAMRLGAADYLAKPFDPAELPLVLARAAKFRSSHRLAERRENESRGPGDDFFFGRALGLLEEHLKKILAADERIQSPLPPVLIVGETGTGKTTIARWVHQRGPRAASPFVEVNCSALPETLAESELFGHERGAFTDAKSARIGLFEAASGGTLFLDELPSLSSGLQAKILKALEDNRIRRVGGTREISVDARIVAATNVDLKKAVAAGQFREDLLQRLDLYRIQIPPLRERGDDIIRLAETLLGRLCKKHRLPPKQLSPAGRERVLACRWPGNVRELTHELERAIVFEGGAELRLEQLPTPVDPNRSPARPDWLNPDYRFPPEGFVLDDAIATLIARALQQTGNNVSAAARLLGVSRDFLRYRLAGNKPGQYDSDAGE